MRDLFLCIVVLGLTACDARNCVVTDAPIDLSRSGAEYSSMRIEKHFSGGLRKLAQAAGCGDGERVAELITDKKLDPNTLSEEGMPLLLWPVHQRNLEGFVALLENGADPNGRASHGGILMHHVVNSGSADMVRAALEHGADPNGINRDQEQLIHIARRARKWDVIEVLLDFGADIDAFDGELYGRTILSTTTGFGDFEHAYWLMERGADPTYEIRLAPASHQERIGAMPILEDIFHRPIDAEAYPEASAWQQKCQALLRSRGIESPPRPRRHGGDA